MPVRFRTPNVTGHWALDATAFVRMHNIEGLFGKGFRSAAMVPQVDHGLEGGLDEEALSAS